jgi:hypothetical protein
MPNIYQNDQTTLVFHSGVDLDKTATARIRIEKPSGIRIQRDAEIFVDEARWNSGTDLDEAGTYKAQLVIHQGANVYYGTVTKFDVYPSFGDFVFVDTERGTAGIEFPIGTRAHPVNNFEDAKVIAEHMDAAQIIDINSNTKAEQLCPAMQELANWLEKHHAQKENN